MTGRARTRARGRSRHWNIPQPETPGAAAASPAQPPQAQPPQAQPPQLGTGPPQAWARPPQPQAPLPPPEAQQPQPQARPPPAWTRPPQPHAQPLQPRVQPPQPQARPPLAWARPPQPHAQPSQPEAQIPQPRVQPPQPQARPPLAWVGPPQLHAQPSQPQARPPLAWARPPQPHAQPSQPEAQIPQPRVQPPQPQARPPLAWVRPPQLHAQPSQPEAQPPQPQARPPLAWARPLQPGAQPSKPKAQIPQARVQPPQPQARLPLAWVWPPQPQARPPLAWAQPLQPHVPPPQPEAQPLTQPPQPGAQIPPEEGQMFAPKHPRGAEGGVPLPEKLPVTAGLQELSIKPDKSVGIFQDLVVNTRKKLNHVQASKRGNRGRTISLQTNHYRVTCDCNVAYKYNIDYRPNIKDINIRASLLLRHQSTLGKCHIFDGHSLLLPQRLPRSDLELVSQTQGGDIVKIRVQLSKELHPRHPDWLRYYNILFRRTLALINLESLGRNNYDLNTRLKASKMQIQLSYNTSILPYENVLTLCADVTHRLLQMKTVYDLITEKADRGVANLVKVVSEELLGSIVFTRYNKKTYRIDDIDWDQSPRNVFKKSDGSTISFIDYYREQYNLVITDMNQPLLVSRGRWRKGQRSTPREPVLLIPQLCYLTGLSSDIRTNHKLMSQLTEKMRMCPKQREKELAKFMKKLGANQHLQDEFRPWKVRFETMCLHISGRVLDTVELYQSGKSSFMTNPQLSNWLKESRSRPLLRPIPLNNWAILYPECCSVEASILLRTLKEVSADMGIDMREARGYKVERHPESYKETLKKHVTAKTQMVVCVLPDHGKHRYDEIKRYLCVQCPVPSQCVVAETLRYEKTLRTMAVKIAQQMNCKMGGALWKVDTDMKNTMFIGIDCFHDIVSRQKSIAAFVASTNEELTKWYSQCLFQEPGQELVSGLRSCLQAALDSWSENVRKAPQSVVVYRDGVGDGQLQALLDSEVSQMVEFFKRGHKPCIRLTFIVVKKRINTRFFMNKSATNPPPGTVVDQVVTREEWYDFYIVSQTSQGGTVTPTHYNVIYDTKGLYPDQVQCLTYKLCHMYYNLPGVIRVPAPCHYAHKLAYLVGKNLHQQPAESLSKYLFYL